MRILLFSNWFPPIRSGSSFYTSSLAQALAARGHDVAVVTLDWGEGYAPPSMSFPIHLLPVVKLPKLPLFYNLKLMGLGFTRQNHRRLMEIVRKHRADLIHHVNHIFDTTFLTVSVARALRIPIVGSITTPIQHQQPMRQAIMALADRWTVGRFGVCRWNGVVCLDQNVHRYVAEQYGPHAAARAAVIPFGVRLESMSQYESRAERAVRPQILHVGHIHPFRNPVQLIRAMPLVLERVPGARVVLAGRVDLQEPVQIKHKLGLTDDQVLFLGDTSHDKIVELMKTSHGYASWVTGPYPALGTAPMEAMLCETPVINDLPEDLFGEGALRNGENIVLVDSKNPRSIADALVRLLTDEKWRQKIGAGGRQFVLEHLSWDRIAGRMEQFYTQVKQKQGQ